MFSPPVRKADGPAPRAVVVGIQLPDVSNEAFASSLTELERLADTLGLEVIGRVTQRRASIAAGTILGEGKLKQLSAFTGGTGEVGRYVAPGKRDKQPEPSAPEEQPEASADDDTDPEAEPAPEAPKAEIVLVDHDLTPGQTRNLEKATGAEVLDRSMVILSIFKRHARTREALIQVEIAQLSYMSPRLRETHAGQDRQRGGVGGKGAGETALELDRRRIRDRIAELRDELEIVAREASTRRSRRLGIHTSSVALVGYTNAGKSSLMKALTADEVYVADQLFATLDTTVRALKPETRPRILVSDTVGFIKKLPHDLVASFRSTLEEAKDADLLLHVVDGSDAAFREQHQVTREVLHELAADANPTLLVINKADRLSADQRDSLASEFPGALILSARLPEDITRLHGVIVEFFEQRMEEASFEVPYSAQRQVALLHERCLVLEETYDERGTTVRVRAPTAVLAELRAELYGRAPAADSGE